MIAIPEGPSTLYLRTLVPNTMKGKVSGTKDLKHCVLGPSGYASQCYGFHYAVSKS